MLAVKNDGLRCLSNQFTFASMCSPGNDSVIKVTTEYIWHIVFHSVHEKNKLSSLSENTFIALTNLKLQKL